MTRYAVVMLVTVACAVLAAHAQESPAAPEAQDVVRGPVVEVEPRELWLSHPPDGADESDPRPEHLSATEKAVGYVAVRNVGDAPLVLERIRSTCGCTVAALEVSELAPGAETRVKVEVVPQQVGGFSINKQISVHTNDPSQPVVPVNIRGEIFPVYEYEPRFFDLGVFEKGEEREASILFRGNGDPVRIDRITTWPGAEGFEVQEQELPEAEWRTPGIPEYRITFRATPLAPSGKLTNVLLVHTSAATNSTLRIPVEADIRSFYSLSRRVAFVGPVTSGATMENVLDVTAERPIELTQVQSSLPELIPQVRYSEDRRIATIDFVVAPDAAHGFRVGTLDLAISADGVVRREQVQLRTAINARK